MIYLYKKEDEGHTDSRVKCRLATFVALLIERMLTISWLLNNRVPAHITLVKQSIRVVKVNSCYIDSNLCIV